MKRMTFFMFMVLLLLTSVAVVSAQGGPPAGVATHIVVFKDNVNGRAAVPEFANAYGLQVTNRYERVLNGFAARVPAGRLRALQRDSRVAYVEENMEVHITAIPTGLQRINADVIALDIDGVDDLRVDVDVAVIDTGVDYQHPDLNVVGGIDCTDGNWWRVRCTVGIVAADDDHYHGTHVAGTIGAKDNGVNVTVNGIPTEVVGVAPGARIHSVKVLNSQGSGYTSWIIAGIDWVVDQGNIEVANMSLGGPGTSSAYADAINNAVANGVVMVVAAGNEDDDARDYSPAFVPAAITVSALADFNGAPGGGAAPTCRDDEDDTLANFSNWGPAVDIAAPGVCITSTYPIEEGNYGTISGTSMASPHVAGAAALIASYDPPQNATDVQALRNTLVNSGNFNWTDDSGDGIKERLLDIASSAFDPAMVGDDNGGGGNTPPEASFTVSCATLTCTVNGNGSSDSDGSIVSYEWDFGDGSTDTGATSENTYAASGTYTIELTVTDNEGASDSTSQNVTVSSGGTGGDPTVLFVEDLAGAISNSGPNWTAIVTVHIVDDAGNDMEGAQVSGNFSVGNSDTCVTNSSGTCSVESNSVRKRDVSSIIFTVSNVSGALPYDSGSNVETQITVTR